MKKKSWRSIFGSWTALFAVAALLIAMGGHCQSIHAGNSRDKTYESLKLFTDVLQELEENYVDEVDGEALIQSAIKGMVSSLDPHSTFMPPEAFDELQDDTKGEFGGIGIVISLKKGLLTVISPIEGTPAYKAGIQAGDVIIKIDGDPTNDLALWESVKKMRGPRGEAVLITIVREGEPDPIAYELVRDIIPMNSVRSTRIAPEYGYIWVTNFRDNTADEIKETLTRLESGEKPLKGLILDLRNNPGGLLNQAVEVSDIFLEQGIIVSIKGRFEQHTEVFEAHRTNDDRTYPLVVLINSGSASASEIVAGALQDHKRALILGSTSFGKGSVQSVRPIRDGFGLKYTIARYYTPNDRSIQAQGIRPDIEVPYHMIEEEKEGAEDQLSPMARMIREKDLKNHLKPETQKEKSDNPEKKGDNKKNDERSPKEDNTPSGSALVNLDKLKRDSQVQRALDLLIGYDLFHALK